MKTFNAYVIKNYDAEKKRWLDPIANAVGATMPPGNGWEWACKIEVISDKQIALLESGEFLTPADVLIANKNIKSGYVPQQKGN